MGDLTDFGDREHRRATCGALLQKAVYHAFVLMKPEESDAFANTLRAYQALFQLCSGLALMDPAFTVPPVRGPVRKKCADPRHPLRSEIDPAASINHSSLVGDSGWGGFEAGHPLRDAATNALNLLARLVDARHNMMYRPFLLARGTPGWYWEDCPLIDAMSAAPEHAETERAIRLVATALADEYILQRGLQDRAIDALHRGEEVSGPGATDRPTWALKLFEEIFTVFKDARDGRPDETILLTYARLLTADDDQIDAVRRHRNELLDLDRIRSAVRIPGEWGLV